MPIKGIYTQGEEITVSSVWTKSDNWEGKFDGM